MKFSAAIIAAAVFSGVQAYSNVTYTTEVLTAYTTYCPEPTTITHGDKTYTVTKATTLTITDCPCTVTKPVLTSTVTKCHNCPPKASVTPPVYHNATTPAGKPTTVVNPTGTISQPPAFTGGAARAGAGAGLAALLGFAAYVL